MVTFYKSEKKITTHCFIDDKPMTKFHYGFFYVPPCQNVDYESHYYKNDWKYNSNQGHCFKKMLVFWFLQKKENKHLILRLIHLYFFTIKFFTPPPSSKKTYLNRVLTVHTSEYGLIKIAKFVRWLHSHTVPLVSRLTNLHPCSDHLLYERTNKW